MVSVTWIQGPILLTKLKQAERNYTYLVETCVQQKSSLCGFTLCIKGCCLKHLLLSEAEIRQSTQVCRLKRWSTYHTACAVHSGKDDPPDIGSNCQVSPAQRKVGQSSGWPVGQLTASKSQVDWKQEWRWWRVECISNKPKHCKPAVVKGQWVVKVVNCQSDKCFRLKRRSVSCKWPSVEAKNKQMKWWAISVDIERKLASGWRE